MTDTLEDIDAEPGSQSPRVYEVGYLLLPSIPEEKVPDETTRIKEIIAEADATVISEDSPKLRTLAYEIDKRTAAGTEHFKSAYFGWVKFESSPGSALAIKKTLDSMNEIIRFILVKTVRDAPPPQISKLLLPSEGSTLLEKPLLDDPIEDAPKVQLQTEDEIDKSIDELVAE